jgi:branched-chain amino acid transport system substrate-binding protein
VFGQSARTGTVATHDVRRPRRRSRGLAGGILAVALVATACDDDAGDAGDATTTTIAPPTAGSSEGVTTDSAATPAPAPEGEPVLTLGMLAPGAGLLNTLVVGQQRGLQLAIDDINAAGGVLGGPVASVTATEAAETPLADTVEELVGHGASVIVGPVGSSNAAALLPILSERQLLACSASATATSLTTSADTAAPPTFVRTALRDDHLAAIVADQLMTPAEGEEPPATVMVVGRDDVYGNELTAGLAADLTARGAAVTTLAYPSRRVQFPEESAAVAAAAPDRVVLVAYEEGPRLVADIVNAGYPVDRIVGLDGMLTPRLAEQTFPDDATRANGLTVIGTTGDRALMNRLRQTAAPQDEVAYGPQMYDCVITLALAAIAAGSAEPAAVAAQIGPVTSGGRACSTFAHCVELLAAGEDIDYDGTTGHLGIDAAGDVSTARVTTARVDAGQLQPVGSQEVDLEAQRQDELFASAILVAQLQQALKALGYYEGDVTGIYDEATTAAVAALQRDLGLPETGQYDAATDAALRERIGSRLQTFGTGVKELQQALTERGFYTGPIDGRYSAETIAAVKAFQTDLGVPPTGIIDVATMRAIYARGVATGEASVPPPPAPTTTKPEVAPTTVPKPPPTEAPAPPEPTTTEPAPATTEKPTPPAGPTLFQALSDDANFSTFMRIAATAGFGTDVAQPGPFTVFAPTNDAFDKLEGDELNKLETDAAAATALLRELIVDDLVTGAELTTKELRTVGGGTIDIVASGDVITAGGAAVTPDAVDASNGVTHALASVPSTG